jgi:hypothetical protein
MENNINFNTNKKSSLDDRKIGVKYVKVVRSGSERKGLRYMTGG